MAFLGTTTILLGGSGGPNITMAWHGIGHMRNRTGQGHGMGFSLLPSTTSHLQLVSCLFAGHLCAAYYKQKEDRAGTGFKFVPGTKARAFAKLS